MVLSMDADLEILVKLMREPVQAFIVVRLVRGVMLALRVVTMIMVRIELPYEL